VEGAHVGHPDFRANGRIFASLTTGERRGGLKLTPAEQRALVGEHPRVFTPASGAWGRQGWTMVELEAAGGPAVRGALLLAWQNVMALPRKGARRRPRA
jgi:hypothetical protein